MLNQKIKRAHLADKYYQKFSNFPSFHESIKQENVPIIKYLA